MDVLDAGVFVAKFEATTPKGLRPVLWGPLQTKEMGLDDWTVQDGGETGFVMHHAGSTTAAGRVHATLIVVRRLAKAFLTVYFGGYPSDVPESQRRLEAQKVVSDAELYLGRLAKEAVNFQFQGEISLVDNRPDAAELAAPAPPRLEPAGADPRPSSGGIWEV